MTPDRLLRKPDHRSLTDETSVFSILGPEWIKLNSNLVHLFNLPEICQERVIESLQVLETMRQRGSWLCGSLVRPTDTIHEEPFLSQFERIRQEIVQALDKYRPKEEGLVSAWMEANYQLLSGVDNANPETIDRRLAWWGLKNALEWVVGDNLQQVVREHHLSGLGLSRRPLRYSLSHMVSMAAQTTLWAVNADRGFGETNLYALFLRFYALGAVEIQADYTENGQPAILVEFPVKNYAGEIDHACLPLDLPLQEVEYLDYHPKRKCLNLLTSTLPYKIR